MSHEIYNNRFISYRQPAWHNLGTVFDMPITADEAWQLMGPYDVTKEPLHYQQEQVDESGNTTTISVPVKDKYVLVGKFPKGESFSYGVVSTGYELVKPKQLVDLWEMTVKANIETMGVLQQGKRFFMTTELQSFDVKGDEHKNYLSIISPHGTNQSLMGIISPVRVVCWNTLQFALGCAKQEMRVWHTKGALNKMGTWMAEQYESTTTRSLEIQEALTRLANREVTDGGVQRFIDRLIPVDQYTTAELGSFEESAATKARDARVDLMELFHGRATGAETQAFKDTYYGLYNAAVEWADYHKRTTSSARWLGANSDFKERAFDIASDLAHA